MDRQLLLLHNKQVSLVFSIDADDIDPTLDWPTTPPSPPFRIENHVVEGDDNNRSSTSLFLSLSLLMRYSLSETYD
jgi:hypothetical protein